MRRYLVLAAAAGLLIAAAVHLAGRGDASVGPRAEEPDGPAVVVAAVASPPSLSVPAAEAGAEEATLDEGCPPPIDPEANPPPPEPPPEFLAQAGYQPPGSDVPWEGIQSVLDREVAAEEREAVASALHQMRGARSRARHQLQAGEIGEADYDAIRRAQFESFEREVQRILRCDDAERVAIFALRGRAPDPAF